jgi:predicted secreted protein
MLSKLLWTTIVSAVIFAIIAVIYQYRLISLDDIPGLPRPPKAL